MSNYVAVRDNNDINFVGELIGYETIKDIEFVVIKQSEKSEIKLYIPKKNCSEIINMYGKNINI